MYSKLHVNIAILLSRGLTFSLGYGGTAGGGSLWTAAAAPASLQNQTKDPLVEVRQHTTLFVSRCCTVGEYTYKCMEQVRMDQCKEWYKYGR